MMSRCQNTGLRLNPDKCFIKQEKIKFYGLICGPDGIQPDPDKVTALKRMATPTSSKELQAFLGLATYMAGTIYLKPKSPHCIIAAITQEGKPV